MNANKTFNDLLPNESDYYKNLFLNKHKNIIKKHFGWFCTYKLGDGFFHFFTLNLTEIDVEESKMIKSDLKYSLYDLDIPVVINTPIKMLMNMNYMYEGLFRLCGSSKRLNELELEIYELTNSQGEKYDKLYSKIVKNSTELDLVEVYKRLMRSFNTSVLGDKLIDYFIKIEKVKDDVEKLICCQAVFYVIKKKNRHLLEHAIRLCMKIHTDVKNNKDSLNIKKHLNVNGFCMTMLPTFFIKVNSTWILSDPKIFISVLEFFFNNFRKIIVLDRTLLELL